VRVTSGGGKYVFDDDQEVPDTQVVTWEFPGRGIVWEHRMWSKHGLEGSGFGIAFYGDKGTLLIDDKGWRVEDGAAAGGPAAEMQAAHLADFLDCVRTRTPPRRDRDRPPQHPALPPGQHRPPHRPQADLRRRHRALPRRRRGHALLSREYSRRFEMPSQV
jgi:predicted dehydrogenase